MYNKEMKEGFIKDYMRSRIIYIDKDDLIDYQINKNKIIINGRVMRISITS